MAYIDSSKPVPMKLLLFILTFLIICITLLIWKYCNKKHNHHNDHYRSPAAAELQNRTLIEGKRF